MATEKVQQYLMCGARNIILYLFPEWSGSYWKKKKFQVEVRMDLISFTIIHNCSNMEFGKKYELYLSIQFYDEND